MKGCIILYIVRIFSSLELVEPHIIPLKVFLAVALKDEANFVLFLWRESSTTDLTGLMLTLLIYQALTRT